MLPLGTAIANIFMSWKEVYYHLYYVILLYDKLITWMTLLPTLNQMLLNMFYLFETRSTGTFHSLTSKKLMKKNLDLEEW